MILIEFRRDPDELRDQRIDPLTSDLGDLEKILLFQDIHLVVGDVTILDFWAIPAFFIGATVLSAVRALPEVGRRQLDIPEGSGRLTFSLAADAVTVHEESRSKEGRVQYQELLNAWEEFSEELRLFVLSEFPGLADHPDPRVRSWFRGEG